MSSWLSYPLDYRANEVQAILSAVQAGECVSVVGLSGAGKSNLLGFIANRQSPIANRQSPIANRLSLVDCNRLAEPAPAAFYQLIRRTLGEGQEATDELKALEAALDRLLGDSPSGLCLLLDRFDALAQPPNPMVFGNLRALRDAHKYALTFVIATRRPLDPHSELAELFYAHTLWLGSLSASDARWNVARYAGRKGLRWDDATTETLIALSWGYPSFLRAVCEAYADGATLDLAGMLAHPAVQRRVAEFWADGPSEEDIRQSGLAGLPLLAGGHPPRPIGLPVDNGQLTAKEHLLLEYFRQHPNIVCEKDDLIRAVWPEDKIYAHGIRDDSLAQLVRRLREKIEPNPSAPRYIHTVPGRGYRYTPG